MNFRQIPNFFEFSNVETYFSMLPSSCHMLFPLSFYLIATNKISPFGKAQQSADTFGKEVRELILDENLLYYIFYSI